MNWEAISASGEIIGAAAVVVSVLYLALQVRSQVRETRLTAIHEVSEGFREGIAATFMDPGLAELFVYGKDDPDALTPAQRVQFIAFVQRNYRVWEDAFYQKNLGRLDGPLWHSMERQYAALLSWPGIRWVWEIRSDFFTPAFRDYVDNVEPGEHLL